MFVEEISGNINGYKFKFEEDLHFDNPMELLKTIDIYQQIFKKNKSKLKLMINKHCYISVE